MRVASFLMALVVMSARAGDLPLVPFPDGADVAVVGEELWVYGLPLMAYEYYSKMPVNDVADFYKDAWNQNGDTADVEKPYLETRIGTWLVLSRLERGHNLTVQFNDAGIQGTHVLVGLSPLPKILLDGRKNQLIMRVPRLSDAKVNSVVASKDGGKVSEVYWMESTDTVDAILARYKQHFERERAHIRGYRIVNDQSKSANYGNLSVDGAKASYRFDAVRGEDNKTRMIAIWQPH